MKILKLSPYYAPERISSSHLTEDLEQAYIAAGFDVEIICPTPTRGISDEEREKYKKIKYEEKYGGRIIIRRFAMMREGRNPVGRALRYVLTNLVQFRKGKKAESVDIVMGASTPPTQGILCGKAAKKLSKKYGKKVPFVYNLQDVFPDSMVTAGFAKKGGLLWKIGRKIEDRTYGYADRIIVISDDIKKNIMEKGVPEEKIEIIPNWIDVNEVRHVPREENKLFDEFGIDRERFIVVYAGNLGRAQGIDTFIDAAKKVRDAEFVIFGTGSSMHEYEERSKDCRNIRMLPLMPKERISEVYSMGDMSLVACKKGTGVGAVPSKTFSIMAAGTPVLLSFDEGSALWKLIASKACGLCVPADDADGLAEAVRFAMDHREELRSMGENARRCAETDYSKECGTSRYVELLKKTVGLHAGEK
ncbi:MAG: glycosyltransferase family 4 protein [Clostridiales bacterium]|nr:glycosyltransferase family 4 protein [Clostridiales bacterium]